MSGKPPSGRRRRRRRSSGGGEGGGGYEGYEGYENYDQSDHSSPQQDESQPLMNDAEASSERSSGHRRRSGGESAHDRLMAHRRNKVIEEAEQAEEAADMGYGGQPDYAAPQYAAPDEDGNTPQYSRKRSQRSGGGRSRRSIGASDAGSGSAQGSVPVSSRATGQIVEPLPVLPVSQGNNMYGTVKFDPNQSQSRQEAFTEEQKRAMHNVNIVEQHTGEGGLENIPQEIIDDSFWRKIFCLPPDNILNNFPPLARSYLQLEWLFKYKPDEFKNPYFYSYAYGVGKSAPDLGRSPTGLSLPKRKGGMRPSYTGEAPIRASHDVSQYREARKMSMASSRVAGSIIIEETEDLEEEPLILDKETSEPLKDRIEVPHMDMQPVPPLAFAQASFWRQLWVLLRKDIAVALRSWPWYLVGYLLVVFGWFLPCIILDTEDVLRKQDESAFKYDPDAAESADYAFAAGGIWQTALLLFPTLFCIIGLTSDKVTGTRDALKANNIRGSVYYFVTLLEIMGGACISFLAALIAGLCTFGEVDNYFALSFYYGLAAFLMHFSFLTFACIFSAIFQYEWGYKIVVLVYSLNFFPFIALIPKANLDLKGGWCFLPAQYIVFMFQAIANPSGGRDNITLQNPEGDPVSPTLDDFWAWWAGSLIYTLAAFGFFMYFTEVMKSMDPRKWYFPFASRIYQECFCPKRLGDDDPEQLGHEHPWYLEQEITNHLLQLACAHKCVSVVDVSATRKGRSGKQEEVLKNISFTMYEGEIFVVMGQSESGKSTLLNSIAGLWKPDAGESSVYGHMSHGVPHDFGYCPQSDTLWPKLTVKQHMQFYASIKGLPMSDDAIYGILDELNIPHDIDRLVGSISYTDKRKLAVAIAFIGDPKFIVLDEPTANMDNFARREIWTYLQHQKKDRVILVSSCEVDEAEVLADRAAVLACGELAACGSREYLSETFHCGYIITVIGAKANSKDITGALKHLAKECGLEDNDDCQVIGRQESLSTIADGSIMGDHEEIMEGSVVSSATFRPGGFFGSTAKKSRPGSRPGSVAGSSPGSAAISPEQSVVSAGGIEGVVRDDGSVSYSQPAARAGSFANARFTKRVETGELNIEGTNEMCSPDGKYGSIRFPFSARVKVPFMLRALETWKDGGNVKNYSIEIYSLRDAFLRSSRLGTFDVELLAPPPMPDSTESRIAMNEVGELTRMSHLKPMLRRRFLLAWNNQPTFWYSIFGPSLLFILAYVIWRVLLDSWSPNSVDALPTTAGVIAGLITNIAFMLLGLFSTDFLVKEKADLIKQQLYMSGCSKTAYWMANLTYDFLIAILPCLVIVIIRYGLADAFLGDVTINSALPLMLAIYAFGHATVCMLVSLITSKRWVAAAIIVTCNAYASFLFALFVCLYAISDENDSLLYSFQWLGWIFGTFSPLYPVMVYVLYPAFQQEASVEVSEKIYVLGRGLGAFSNAGIVDSWFAPQMFSFFPSLTSFSYSEEEAKNNLAEAFNPEQAQNRQDYIDNTLLWDDDQPVASESVRQFISIDGQIIPENDEIVQVLHNAGSRLVAGDQLVRLIVIVIVYFAVACTLEYLFNQYWFKQKFTPQEEVPEHALGPDEECVQKEESRVDQLTTQIQMQMHEGDEAGRDDLDNLFPCVFARDLRRAFKGADKEIIHALRGITWASQGGEVFGLLGEKGSGKTTAIDCMAGTIVPSGGQLRISGYDYEQSWHESRRIVGYIGQNDALWEDLTVEQNLYIYAEIRGLRTIAARKQVEYHIAILQLQQYKHEKVRYLAVGARRKLSWGIALIGEPKVIFADQPTTGMDPLTRRFMIGLMKNIALDKPDGCVIVGTHLMEEASMLCDRMALLVDGTFRCIGSPSHIYQLHAQGFELCVYYREPESYDGLGDRRDKVGFFNTKMSLVLEKSMKKVLGDSFVKAEVDALKAIWVFHVEGSGLADVFEHVEALKERCHIETFTISQVTLERVYHYFAMQKTDFDYEREEQQTT